MDEVCLLSVCRCQPDRSMLTVTCFFRQALETLDLSVQVRKKYLKVLYRTCGHHALLPTTMHIPARYDRMADALYTGGCGDVWKGEYRNREVAVKVIRTYSSSDLKKVIGVGCVSPSSRPSIN